MPKTNVNFIYCGTPYHQQLQIFMKTSSILAACAVGSVMLTSSVKSEAAQVAVFGNQFDLNVINDFYNSLAGHGSSIIPTLSGASLSGVSLLWAVQPAASYTGSELSVMSSFLNGGGRIAFLGEHGQFAPAENNRITSAISSLGGSISIVNTILDSGYQDATIADGQILSHPLTTGVSTYNYAAFAPLILGPGDEALMLGADQTSVMMAYENIGSGSIFLITDQNVWDNVNAASNDNARMFENLLSGNTGAPPVDNGVPDGGSSALLLGLSLTGLMVMKKRKSSSAAT